MNPATPAVSSEWRKEKVERICFRGDSRGPDEVYQDDVGTSGQIGDSGLHGKDPRLSPSYRQQDNLMIGDAENGVCVSKLFQTAVRFPLLSGKSHTWIYAVWISRAYNTHRKQVMQGLDMLESTKTAARYTGLAPDDHAKEVLWALFGEELVTDYIPAHHVIAGVRCQRLNPLDVKNWDVPINYALLAPLWINERCTVDPVIRQAGIDFLTAELTNHSTGQSTVRASGFARSTSA